MKKMTLLFTAIMTFAALNGAQAAKPNLTAPQGGIMNYNFDNEPESLHPIMAGDQYESYFAAYVHDTLCTYDIENNDIVPALAEKIETSKDGLSFTFHIRKNAFFHNGDPVTADDVKFSLDTIKEPRHQALNMVPYIETFKKVEVIDKHTIKFTASEKYFKNLESLCGIIKVIPKSVYGDINKSIKLQKEAVGAGPYKFERYDKGQMIVVKKFDKWYGKDVKDFKGYFNFDQINFRFTKDDSILIERLKKGEVDFAEMKSIDTYLKAKGGPFGKTVFAKKVKNSSPKSYGFVGFNFKNPILKDLNVRKALALLFNRPEMNKKFKEGMADLATGPVSVNSNQAADVKPILFDPKAAQELLKKSGWSDSDKNGVLDKMDAGKKLEMKFTLIYANKDSEKYFTIVKEDYKKAGIELTLKYMEWNSFVKAIDDRNIEMFAMGWGAGSIESDPKQIWHSSSDSKGGSNYGGYKNPEVDKLIEEGRAELDKAKRTKIFKKVYTLIAEDVPYIFMFNNKFDFYAMSNKVKAPTETYRYGFGQSSWWSASAPTK
jgi:ABC-type transport system substrate-binding protein